VLSHDAIPILRSSLFYLHFLFPIPLFFILYFFDSLIVPEAIATQRSYHQYCAVQSLTKTCCFCTLRPYHTLDLKIPWMWYMAQVRVRAEERARLMCCTMLRCIAVLPYCAALLRCTMLCCVAVLYYAVYFCSGLHYCTAPYYCDSLSHALGSLRQGHLLALISSADSYHTSDRKYTTMC
jgi:hypothetical protein